MVSVELLRPHYGHSDAYLMHALVDVKINGERSKAVQVLNIGTKSTWNALQMAANATFGVFRTIIEQVEWETLVNITEQPKFLKSLQDIAQEILDTEATDKLLQMSKAFYAGASRLWDFLKQLLGAQIADYGAIFAYINDFSSLLVQYGRNFVDSVKYIFSGIRKIIDSIIVLYQKAMIRLSEFSSSFVDAVDLIPTMGSIVIQQVHEISIQTVLFTFIGMQNVVELLNQPRSYGIRYTSRFCRQLNDMVTNLGRLIASLDMSGAVKSILVSLLELPTIRKLVNYMETNYIVDILSRIFLFIGKTLSSIHGVVHTYLENIATRMIDKLADVGRQIFDIPQTNQARMNELIGQTQRLSRHPDVSAETRSLMMDAVRRAEQLELLGQKHSRQKYVNGFNFDDVRFSSKTLTDMYFGRQVSQSDQDRMCRISTGLTVEQFSRLLITTEDLMLNRTDMALAEISLAKRSRGKFKVEAKLIAANGDETNVRLDQEKAEKMAYVEKLKLEIVELTRKKGELAENANYDEAVSNLETLLVKSSSQDLREVGYERSRKEMFELRVEMLKGHHGITAVEKRIAQLTKEIDDVERSIIRQDAQIRKWAAPVIAAICGSAFLYGVFSVVRNQFYDAKFARKTVFSNLIEASGHDPLLIEHVTKYVEFKGISPTASSTDTLDDFNRFVRDQIYGIRRNQIPIDEIERSFIGTIESSISHTFQITQEKKERGKEPYFARLWSFFDKQEQAPQIEAGEATGLSVFGSSPVLGNQLADINPAALFDGPGGYAAPEKTAREALFRKDVANVLQIHLNGLSGLIKAERQSMIDKKRFDEGIVSSVVGMISDNWAASGIPSISTESKDRYRDVINVLSKGGTSAMSQLIAYYQAHAMILLYAVRLSLLIVCSLTFALVQTWFGEVEQARTTLSSVRTELVNIFGLVAAELAQATSAISNARFSSFMFVFKAIMAFVPFGQIVSVLSMGSSALKTTFSYLRNWTRTPQNERQLREDARKRDGRLSEEQRREHDNDWNQIQKDRPKTDSRVQCRVCVVEPAQYSDADGREKFYCTYACAAIDTPSYHNFC